MKIKIREIRCFYNFFIAQERTQEGCTNLAFNFVLYYQEKKYNPSFFFNN